MQYYKAVRKGDVNDPWQSLVVNHEKALATYAVGVTTLPPIPFSKLFVFDDLAAATSWAESRIEESESVAVMEVEVTEPETLASFPEFDLSFEAFAAWWWARSHDQRSWLHDYDIQVPMFKVIAVSSATPTRIVSIDGVKQEDCDE